MRLGAPRRGSRCSEPAGGVSVLIGTWWYGCSAISCSVRFALASSSEGYESPLSTEKRTSQPPYRHGKPPYRTATHDSRRKAAGLYLAAAGVVTSLAERAELVASLADRRAALVTEDEAGGAKDRARQLRDHVRAYVLPRVRAIESPLLVVLLGPAGAGKSTLLNTLVRPTIR